jgi:hypothetical protein
VVFSSSSPCRRLIVSIHERDSSFTKPAAFSVRLQFSIAEEEDPAAIAAEADGELLCDKMLILPIKYKRKQVNKETKLMNK